MGSNDVDMSSKEGKKAKKEPGTPVLQHSQEQTSPVYGPAASGFQVYFPRPPHGYMASSPQGQPYMWPVPQFFPPYGTPFPPYIAMYPHGGVYPHPTMAPGSYPFSPFAMPSPNGNAEVFINSPVETDDMLPEGKKKLPIKRSRVSFSSLTAKNNETDRTSTPSANDVCSKSGESASGDSSGGSDEKPQNSGSGVDSAESQNGSATHSPQNGGRNPTPCAGPVTGVLGTPMNLNFGVDYGGGTPTCNPAMQCKKPATPVNGTQDNVQSRLWIEDEKELKRQKRKQSNRESARRSRQRKQAECDELAQLTESLKEENASLRAEVTRIRSDYEQLLAQNASLQERLGEEADCRCSLELDGL